MKRLVICILLSILAGVNFDMLFASEAKKISGNTYFQTRSSYNTWYSFDRFLKTEPRYFDGNDICFVSDKAQNDLPEGQIQYAKLKVSLYRGNKIEWFHDNKVGDTIEVPMVGKWKARWDNVGKGRYFFYIKKKDNQFPDAAIFDHKVTLTNNCDNF